MALVALASLLWLPSRSALGVSYVVDTLDDDPDVTKVACAGAADDCSLRGAITKANAASSPGDVITFDSGVFPMGAPATIGIGTVLPQLSGGGDTIDGSGAGVVIDGTGEALVICFPVGSAGNTIKGLQITDCSIAILLSLPGSDANTIGPGNTLFDNLVAIKISNADASGNTIIGNKIGTDAAGTAVPGEGGNGSGLEIEGSNNTRRHRPRGPQHHLREHNRHHDHGSGRHRD